MLLDEGIRRQALFVVRVWRRFKVFASQEPQTASAVVISVLVTLALWLKILEVFIVNLEFDKLLEEIRDANRNLTEIEKRRQALLLTSMMLYN